MTHDGGHARLRPAPGRLFVDESGQFRAARPNQPAEIAVLAGVFVRDVPENIAELRRVVSAVRARAAARQTGSRSVKAADFTDKDWDALTGLIRANWYVIDAVAKVTEQEVELFESTLGMMRAALADSRSRIRSGASRDLRIDFLERQLEDAASRHPIYLCLLFHMYVRLARWFRHHGMLPQLQTVVDEKLPRQDVELVNFVGRLAFYTTFPAVYRLRLGEIVGIDESRDFRCRVGSDDDDDGLVLADAVAFVCGKIARGQDPDRRFAELRQMMWRDHD